MGLARLYAVTPTLRVVRADHKTAKVSTFSSCGYHIPYRSAVERRNSLTRVGGGTPSRTRGGTRQPRPHGGKHALFEQGCPWIHGSYSGPDDVDRAPYRHRTPRDARAVVAQLRFASPQCLILGGSGCGQREVTDIVVGSPPCLHCAFRAGVLAGAVTPEYLATLKSMSEELPLGHRCHVCRPHAVGDVVGTDAAIRTGLREGWIEWGQLRASCGCPAPAAAPPEEEGGDASDQLSGSHGSHTREDDVPPRSGPTVSRFNCAACLAEHYASVRNNAVRHSHLDSLRRWLRFYLEHMPGYRCEKCTGLAMIGREVEDLNLWAALRAELAGTPLPEAVAYAGASDAPPLRPSLVTARAHARIGVAGQLNGHHGEWTGSDDVVQKARASAPASVPFVEGPGHVHARRLVFGREGARDPLAPDSETPGEMVEVTLVAQVLASNPCDVQYGISDGTAYCRAMWCDGTPAVIDGPHSVVARIWGRPTFVLELRRRVWTLYEYQGSDNHLATTRIVSELGHPEYAEASIVTLLGALDRSSGSASGTHAAMLREVTDGTGDRLRTEVLRHVQESGVDLRPHVAPVCHTEHRHISVREMDINGSNGSSTDKDDVKGPKGGRKAKRPEALADTVQRVAGRVGRAGGAALATAAGVPDLAPAFASLGQHGVTHLVKLIRHWSGLGDYYLGLAQKSHGKVVRQNTLLHGMGKEVVTNLRADPNVCSDAYSDDYIGPVAQGPLGGGSTYVLAFVVNPGDKALFPNAATAVSPCCQYRPRGLIFTYQSIMANFSTNGPLGSMAVGWCRDVSAPAPTTLDGVMRLENPILKRANESWAYPVECDPRSFSRKMYNIRLDGNPGRTVDASDYDCGVLYVAYNIPDSVASMNTMLGHLKLSAHWCVGQKEIGDAVYGYAHFRRTSYNTTTMIMGDPTTEQNGARIGSLRKATLSGTQLSLGDVPNNANVLISVRWVASGTAVTWAAPSRTATYLTDLAVLSEGSALCVTPLSADTTQAAEMKMSYRVSRSLAVYPTLTLAGGTIPSNTPVQVEVIVTVGTINPVAGSTA